MYYIGNKAGLAISEWKRLNKDAYMSWQYTLIDESKGLLAKLEKYKIDG